MSSSACVLFNAMSSLTGFFFVSIAGFSKSYFLVIFALAFFLITITSASKSGLLSSRFPSLLDLDDNLEFALFKPFFFLFPLLPLFPDLAVYLN
jgi:hypothetical protein